MDFSLVYLFAAFGGGLFGAAIGGQPAFIFTGFMVLVGVATGLTGGEYDFLTNVAFGPVFGPHIAFAGGVAAVAFAARRGQVDSGRDIAAPMAGIGDPMPLIVGGLFGMGGYVVQVVLASVLVAGTTALTDSVALTVAISAVVVRLMFGKSGPFGTVATEAEERGRFFPGGKQVWVIHQQGWVQASVLGVGSGLLSAWIITSVPASQVAAATTLTFGISAVSLLLLQFGLNGPVTHHMTLPAAVAAAAVVGAGGPAIGALLAAVAAGVLGAVLGEVTSRLFLIHGDTHVDPPAFAIFMVTSVVVAVQLATGAV